MNRELSIRHDADPNTIVKLGDKIETLILTLEDKEGRLLLSKKRAQYERAWGDIEAIKNADGTVEGLVIEAVKGGLIVDIGLRGFLPASLVELRRVRDLAPYLGQRITAKILELDRQRNNVVLSRRALLEESQKGTQTDFLENIAVGEVRTGRISSVVAFGAFVDLGGIVDVEKEKARLTKELLDLEKYITAQESKLSNADFVGRAPEKVVEGEKKKLSDAKEKFEKMTVQLNQIV